MIIIPLNKCISIFFLEKNTSLYLIIYNILVSSLSQFEFVRLCFNDFALFDLFALSLCSQLIMSMSKMASAVSTDIALTRKDKILSFILALLLSHSEISLHDFKKIVAAHVEGHLPLGWMPIHAQLKTVKSSPRDIDGIKKMGVVVTLTAEEIFYLSIEMIAGASEEFWFEIHSKNPKGTNYLIPNRLRQSATHRTVEWCRRNGVDFETFCIVEKHNVGSGDFDLVGEMPAGMVLPVDDIICVTSATAYFTSIDQLPSVESGKKVKPASRAEELKASRSLTQWLWLLFQDWVTTDIVQNKLFRDRTGMASLPSNFDAELYAHIRSLGAIDSELLNLVIRGIGNLVIKLESTPVTPFNFGPTVDVELMMLSIEQQIASNQQQSNSEPEGESLVAQLPEVMTVLIEEAAHVQSLTAVEALLVQALHASRGRGLKEFELALHSGIMQIAVDGTPKNLEEDQRVVGEIAEAAGYHYSLTSHLKQHAGEIVEDGLCEELHESFSKLRELLDGLVSEPVDDKFSAKSNVLEAIDGFVASNPGCTLTITGQKGPWTNGGLGGFGLNVLHTRQFDEFDEPRAGCGLILVTFTDIRFVIRMDGIIHLCADVGVDVPATNFFNSIWVTAGEFRYITGRAYQTCDSSIKTETLPFIGTLAEIALMSEDQILRAQISRLVRLRRMSAAGQAIVLRAPK